MMQGKLWGAPHVGPTLGLSGDSQLYIFLLHSDFHNSTPPTIDLLFTTASPWNNWPACLYLGFLA